MEGEKRIPMSMMYDRIRLEIDNILSQPEFSEKPGMLQALFDALDALRRFDRLVLENQKRRV